MHFWSKSCPNPVVAKLLVVVSLIFALCGHESHAAAVMSVDLGTEWMKVGVVSPGVPMEIALNKESKRKTPTILSFRDGIRNFGEDAVTVGIRDPAAAYGYLLDLLGKDIDNPIVNLYKERFPYYDLVADETRHTVIFKKPESDQFSVEELIAQMLTKAKEFAQQSTQQIISECVLTVPSYFGQAERQALLSAARLANLKVLQLINDYAAVALNYGVFHRAEINETAQYFVFYDMGAYKTSAAVVSYQLVKDKHTKEINPVIQVLGVGYDRTLGGLEIQLRLRDYLAAEFNALGKTKTDVTKNPRALAKLFKEAGRVKNVLSANNDHFAQIENLLEDHDFRLQVTRAKLEELCGDLWARVLGPLQHAIQASGLSLENINQVIIVGGGTRVPKVQEILKDSIKKDLGKSLNADEAATMGAVYKAADLATGFKVKKFIIKDAVTLPIQISFQRVPDDGGNIRQVKRVLFGHLNPYPQKKMITFNKHTNDFDFHVHYGDLNHLSAEEISRLGSLNISHVKLHKVNDLIERNQQNLIESKGIKAHFSLDDSGVLKLSSIEYVFEKQKTNNEDSGTLAKLGSTISKLFSKDKEPGKEEQEENTAEDGQTENKTTETDNPTKVDEDVNINENKTANATEEIVRNVTVKEPVEHTVTIQFSNPLSDQDFEKSLNKLTSINSAEQERIRLESALNALESHVIEIQQKLSEDDYASCTSPEEKETILNECSAVSDWLYEDIESPTAEMYEKRLSELKALTNVFMAKHWEHEERPGALKALDALIDGAKKVLSTISNLTKEKNPEKDIFTEIEIETLSRVIAETAEWKIAEKAAQDKLQRYEEVRLTVQAINEKMSSLDREVKYLLNKMKFWKPRKPVNKNTKEKEANAGKTDAENTAAEEAETDGTDTEKSDAENLHLNDTTGSGSSSNYENIDQSDDQVEVPITEESAEVKDSKRPEGTTPRSDL